MRLPRFRLRTLMVAVAVAGLAVAGVHLWRLGREYQRRAEQYAGPVRWAGDGNADLEARQRLSPAEFGTYMLRRDREVRSWRARMEAKYRRAARYPWLPVAPDPPEPE